MNNYNDDDLNPDKATIINNGVERIVDWSKPVPLNPGDKIKLPPGLEHRLMCCEKIAIYKCLHKKGMLTSEQLNKLIEMNHY